MKDNECKKLFRMFSIVDYLKEEEFLREQHKKGYKFVRFVFPGFYYFEKCQPEDVVYQLDYANYKMEEKRSYLQIFEDAGWEYLFDVWGWSYFRKSVENGECDTSIFSDLESRLALLKRIIYGRMLPFLTVFFCCCLQNFLRVLDRVLSKEVVGGFQTGLMIFWIVIFGIYLFMFIKCTLGFIALRKRYVRVSQYDKANQKPVIHCSICNGEQVAGFKNIYTGKFEEIMTIRSERDLQKFKSDYEIFTEIEKEY